MKKVVVRVQCPDRPGLVHDITGVIAKDIGANLDSLEQHIFPDEKIFFMRATFDMPHESGIAPVCGQFSRFIGKYQATVTVDDADARDRLALFATKEVHCLEDVLSEHSQGNLPADIALIISNHESPVADIARRFNIGFRHVPVEKQGDRGAERRHLDLLREHGIQLVGLARYMRIVGEGLVKEYPSRIINIHHSFLPAFVGANPYRKAYERGVKMVGATAHFVTAELDQGPIISQNTAQVDDFTSVEGFKRIGRKIEKQVFVEALSKFLERKTMVFGNRVIVFK